MKTTKAVWKLHISENGMEWMLNVNSVYRVLMNGFNGSRISVWDVRTHTNSLKLDVPYLKHISNHTSITAAQKKIYKLIREEKKND